MNRRRGSNDSVVPIYFSVSPLIMIVCVEFHTPKCKISPDEFELLCDRKVLRSATCPRGHAMTCEYARFVQ